MFRASLEIFWAAMCSRSGLLQAARCVNSSIAAACASAASCGIVAQHRMGHGWIVGARKRGKDGEVKRPGGIVAAGENLRGDAGGRGVLGADQGRQGQVPLFVAGRRALASAATALAAAGSFHRAASRIASR